MAYKKIRNDVYIADTKEDLNLIKEKDIGSVCEVIKEACDYKLMSTGEWVKQVPAASGSASGETEIDTSMFATKEELENAIDGIIIPSIDGLASEEFVEEAIASIEHPAVDLTGLATEEYVNEKVDSIVVPSVDGLATEAFVEEKVAAIEHPTVDLAGYATETYVDESVATIKVAIDNEPVMKMFDEDPSIMASNPGSKFGIALNNGDTRTLPEAMLEKGVGLYNFWVHKSNQSLPAEVLEKNSSCRGLCCVDTVKETGWYGWALLFDQDGEIYTQYIRNAEPKGWKALATK